MNKTVIILIATIVIGVAIFFVPSDVKEEVDCIKPEPFKQNQMVDGCVIQKTGDIWIKTCG
jgi:hypothetical protein